MKFDTERVIFEIKSRPALWDTRCEAYKDRNEKQNAWIEVTKRLSTNYKVLTLDEKHKSVEKVIQRWKSARDQYVRSKTADKNNRSPDKKIKKYVYAENMAFLDPIINIGNTQGLPLSPSASQETPQSAAVHKPLPQKNNLRPPKRRHEKFPHFEDEAIKVFREDTDEDMCFFQSMLPRVKSIPEEKKLQFQVEFLQLLIKYQSISSSSHSNPDKYFDLSTHSQDSVCGYNPEVDDFTSNQSALTEDYIIPKSENFTSEDDE